MTTLITDNRKAALAVGYAATDWNEPISFKKYKESLSDWLVRSLMKDGICIGAIFSKDGEVHVSVVKEVRGKWATRGLLKQIFSNGNYKTRVSKGNEHMFGILNRMGLFCNEQGFFEREE